MYYVVREIPLKLDEPEQILIEKAAKRLMINKEDIRGIRIVRQSLDARKKSDIQFKYTVEAQVTDPAACARLGKAGAELTREAPKSIFKRGDAPVNGRVVVVGAGPCGLFCAYTLAQQGMRPLVIERGQQVEARSFDFERLREQGILNPESNVCFGEGGAGAFSDGKLTTRIKDGRIGRVLETLVQFGAPREILYMAKPHMGTEKIRATVAAMRRQTERLGGEFLFGAKLIDIRQDADGLCGMTYEQNGQRIQVDTNCMVLAIGHSARDTLEMLYKQGVQMEQKAFAIGLRVEHPRMFIDQTQYASFAGHPRLGAAEYRLSAKYGERGVYTFCMCPGGEVICSASEEGYNAVNGMSYYKRDAVNSNSAVVVNVTPKDYPGGPLAGIDFQRRYERRVFEMAGGYGAPVQKLGDFIKNTASTDTGGMIPSYKPYTVFGNIRNCLPDYVGQGITEGFRAFGRAFRGFDGNDTLLTGIETRTSSPVRIVRDERMTSVSIPGLYPAGEGAGYAGGIVSAAVDGIKAATEVLEKFKQEVQV